MRQDTAFHPGEAISQKVIGAADRKHASIGSITVDAHLHRTADMSDVFPGIEADNLSAMPAIADALRKTGLDPATDRCRPGCGIAALGERSRRPARSFSRGCAENPPGRPLGRDCFPDPTRIAGRPALLVDDIVSSGGTMIACAKALHIGRRHIDRRHRHSRAVSAGTLRDDDSQSGIRSIRSTDSVPHPTNAIALDDLFVDALQAEMTLASNPENRR